MRLNADAPRPRELALAELTDPQSYRLTSLHPSWAAMRHETPMCPHRMGDTAIWSVTRYEHVQKVIGDHRRFGSTHGTILAVVEEGDPAGNTAINLTDPPEHTALRLPTMQLMTARAVNRARPEIRQNVRKLLSGLVADGGGDFALAIRPLALTVVGDTIGLPRGVWHQVADAAMAGVAPNDPHFRLQDVPRTLRSAHHTLFTVLGECLDRADARGADTVLARLSQIEVGGKRLSRQEILINAYSFVMGANTTTPHVASQLLLELLRTPALLQQLREDRSLIGSVVEEGLRWATPTNHLVRKTRRPVSMAGRDLAAGEFVCAWIASANHDERMFGDPWTFSPGRRSTARHLAFGRGAHYCIGAPPAREVLAILLDELLALPAMELAGDAEHLESNFINGVSSLPIKIGA